MQVGQPVTDDLSPITNAEKARLFAAIDQHKYVPKKSKFNFRKHMGPYDLAIRTGACLMLLGVTYWTRGNTPRAREDREWLLTFSLVMLIFFFIMHTIAYLPSAMFGSCSDMIVAARGMGAYAASSFNEVQWCAVLLITLIAIWPFVAFFMLIYDGFNPYDELTAREIKLDRGGLAATCLRLGRVILHLYLMIVAIYMVTMVLLMFILRNTQTKKGQFSGLAKKMSNMPYGALFFQGGEEFDCSLCLNAMWKGQEVVRVVGSDDLVFHVDCLKEYIEVSKKTSLPCGTPIVIQVAPVET